ncbi:hypothetical protein BGZ74_004099 [Mortierella antarctica]|nr:hypothetical protein BGZ74_004099 [Mortierella antarctica]
MAMATPVPHSTPRNRSNDYLVQTNGYPDHPPTPHRRQQLKTSKSVDNLAGRARSHTVDTGVQGLRNHFHHLYVDSPSLTKTQLEAYGTPPSPADSYERSSPIPTTLNRTGSGHSSGHSSTHGQDQDEPNHYHHRPRQQRPPQGQSQLRQDQTFSPNYQPYQNGSSGSSSTGANGGVGGGLQVVQSNHVASRSTPKLTLYAQTTTQHQQLIKESKETRSFNGTPTAHIDSKPKAKTSRLKPIVTVENTNEDHVERDQYGFKKESQWLSHHDFVIFENYYIPIMERRRQKWAIFMNDSHGQLPPRSAKLKRYIRKGIPPALRGEAWFHYSGAEDKCKANPGLFKKLVAQAKARGSSNEHAEVIERDLHRTFPENINFKSQITQQQDGGSQLSTDNVPAIQSLRRVLLAFSLHCPTIGYCQSLNYIAGMLLLFMNEEHSFWTLAVIIQNFLPEGMYDVTMEGANIDQAVLMTLVMERLPGIWAKFSGGATSVEMDEGPGLPTVTLVTSHWFLTLFINILPVESILRVWDCFFYEGRKILFRIALTILRQHEAEISKIDDPLEVFQVVQNIPKRLIDCHKLMETCFKRMGSFDLTTKDIDRRYDQFRAKRKATRAAAASRK